MKLLDLFCGAGGAAEGYRRAGFTDIKGVDIRPQPRYPFRFIEGEALEFLAGVRPGEYDLIHASPPCQRYSALRNCGAYQAEDFPDFLPAVRALLQQTGIPYVIENVVGAPMHHHITLCGAAFGLRTYRHRLFEASHLLMQPEHPRHVIRTNRRNLRRRAHWDEGGFVTVVGDIGRYVGPEAMGIDWMTGAELSQAIPPAFTEWVGLQMLAAMENAL